MRPFCIGALVVLFLFASPVRADDAIAWPEKQWAWRKPQDVGLSPKQLDALRDLVGGRGCVVRHGY